MIETAAIKTAGVESAVAGTATIETAAAEAAVAESAAMDTVATEIATIGTAASEVAVIEPALAEIAPVTARAPVPVPVLVLGGSGYVAGEALRLLAGHPLLRVAGVISESQAGQPVEAAFPHLAGAYPAVCFSAAEDLPRLLDRATAAAGAGDVAALDTAGAGQVAALCAAPHGAAAGMVDRLLAAAESAGTSLRVADLSADFRFASAADYERVYGHPHGAPARLAQFRCALPEHAGLAPGLDRLLAGCGSDGGALAAEGRTPLFGGGGGDGDGDGAAVAAGGTPRFGAGDAGAGIAAPGASGAAGHVGHPGCFTTAVLLAAVPLVRLGWIEPELHVVAVTGSTGAGRTPSPSTHHPARRSNLFAYSPLGHRHQPEMRALAEAAAGEPVEIHFVPQAGPFARGIYATLQARLRPRSTPAGAGHDAETTALVAADLARFYAAAPFVDVLGEPPRMQDVVGTNRCRLGVVVAGDRLVAFSAIDNLTKGAAGGGIQWLNLMLGFPETAGLTQPGIGWL